MSWLEYLIKGQLFVSFTFEKLDLLAGTVLNHYTRVSAKIFALCQVLQYLKPLEARKDWEKWVPHLAWQMQMVSWCYLKELQEKKRRIRRRTNNSVFIINYYKRSFVLGLDLQAKWRPFCSGWCKILFGRQNIIVFAVCFSFSEDASLTAASSPPKSHPWSPHKAALDANKSTLGNMFWSQMRNPDLAWVIRMVH